MAIRVICTSCRTSFEVKEAFGGKRGKCPMCSEVLVVPPAAAPDMAIGLAPLQAAATEAESLNEEPKPVAKKKLKRPAPERNETELLNTLLQAFDGDVEPVRTTLGYRFGIVLVTFAMLLLPLIYMALIAGVGYFVYWHATKNLSHFASMRNSWILVFAYGGPLVAGVILLFFMIKPLFAPASHAGSEKVLQPNQEAILYAFVSRIARAIKAPEPRQIEVSCEVNASASLGGLFGKNLTLTLGLPLVAGLNARQFAGVVAHELGHFSQGAGMRFSYIVRTINFWFVRVVYERDSWDERLVQGATESGRLAPIIWFAMLCVWATRWVLWVLMIISHLLSCILLRQMEYDADRTMARVAGCETFEEIARRLALWDASSHAIFSLAGSWWFKDRYPDDLPKLILSNADRIPKKLHRKIQQSLNKSRTGIFDSHPCLKDRMANVSREATDGIFNFDEPATVLLSDFTKLTRQATLKFHQSLFGRHVKREQMVAVVDLEDSA